MCGDYNLRREKRYVEVDVHFTPDGKIRPLAINYDKTRTYGIDRVLAVKHGTSRLGGKGHCFTYLLMWHSRLPRTTCPFQAKDSASARKSGR